MVPNLRVVAEKEWKCHPEGPPHVEVPVSVDQGVDGRVEEDQVELDVVETLLEVLQLLHQEEINISIAVLEWF